MWYVCTEINTTNVAGLYAQYLSLSPSSVFSTCFVLRHICTFQIQRKSKRYSDATSIKQGRITLKHNRRTSIDIRLQRTCLSTVAHAIFVQFQQRAPSLACAHSLLPTVPKTCLCLLAEASLLQQMLRLECPLAVLQNRPELNVTEHNRQPRHGSAANMVLCRLLLKMHRQSLVHILQATSTTTLSLRQKGIAATPSTAQGKHTPSTALTGSNVTSGFL